MGTLNRHAYQQLVDEDLEWLDKQPQCLERDHIRTIVKQSPDTIYGLLVLADALGTRRHLGISVPEMLEAIRELKAAKGRPFNG